MKVIVYPNSIEDYKSYENCNLKEDNNFYRIIRNDVEIDLYSKERFRREDKKDFTILIQTSVF